MLVAVVDLEVADLERGDLHDLVKQLVLDWRAVDEEVAVLHPELVVVSRGGIALDRDADAACELHVQVQVGIRVVEALSERDELILVHGAPGDELGGCRIPVGQVLVLLRERAAPGDLDSGEVGARFLGRLEYVHAALIGGADVLDL